MKHPDISGICSLDWESIIRNLPSAAAMGFSKAREYRAECAVKMLNKYDAGEDCGLKTYDPDYAGWIKGEEAALAALGERIEQIEHYARQRLIGVVDAARQIATTTRKP